MSGEYDEDVAIRRCGDTAILIDCSSTSAVRSIYETVRGAKLPGVIDIIPAARTVLLKFDPEVIDGDRLRGRVAALPRTTAQAPDATLMRLPVCYDGEDLENVARLTGLNVDEVVAAHTGQDWHVAFCGFAPGFAYLIGGDPRLEVPRRDEARVRVPSGAVALAGGFSAVYPRESPGGWQLIGHTDATLWDVTADPPALLRPGFSVRFVDQSAI